MRPISLAYEKGGGRGKGGRRNEQSLAYADTAYVHNIQGAELKSGSRQGRMRPRTFPPLRLSASPSSFAKKGDVLPGFGLVVVTPVLLSLNLPPPLGTFQRQVGRGFESVEDQPMLYGLAQTSFNLLLSPRPRFSIYFSFRSRRARGPRRDIVTFFVTQAFRLSCCKGMDEIETGGNYRRAL